MNDPTTPEAKRRRIIETYRDQALILCTPRLSPAALTYWTEWVIECYPGIIPLGPYGLHEWAARMDEAAGEAINAEGFPEGWSPDDWGVEALPKHFDGTETVGDGDA